MTSPQSPTTTRQTTVQRWITQPSFYPYKVRHLFNATRERASKFHILQLCLITLSLAGIGYYAYLLADKYVYQSFQNWTFEESIAGRTNVTFFDYLSARTALGFLNRAQKQAVSAPAYAAVIGQLEIPCLHLSAIVREGVDDKVLRVAVGHVSATTLAGQKGNFAIAAHRNTAFRALKSIGNGDLITFQTLDGRNYQYRVAATQIVKPSDASVLRADGGGLITDSGSVQGMPKLLTVITYYPFSSVGSAPRRFVVEARLIENEEPSKEAIQAAASEQAIAAPESQAKPEKLIHHSKARAHRLTHRKTSRIRHAVNRPAARTPFVSGSSTQPIKKKSFWRKLF